MKAALLDLHNKSAAILRALARNKPVTVYHRGKPVAVMHPTDQPLAGTHVKTKDHPAFGVWSDRYDVADPAAHVRNLRSGRFR